jgi:hypothetical protein
VSQDVPNVAVDFLNSRQSRPEPPISQGAGPIDDPLRRQELTQDVPNVAEGTSHSPQATTEPPIAHGEQSQDVRRRRMNASSDDIRESVGQPVISHNAPRSQVRAVATIAEPIVDGIAATLSLAALRLPSGSLAAKAAALTSGVLWGGSGIVGEVGNANHSKVITAANILNVTAGALSAVSPFRSPIQTGYASAAAWAANGAGTLLHAIGDDTRNTVSRLLEGAAGFAGLAAAGLSAAATNASTRNEGVTAAQLALASSVVWMSGAGFGLWSVMAHRDRSLAQP